VSRAGTLRRAGDAGEGWAGRRPGVRGEDLRVDVFAGSLTGRTPFAGRSYPSRTPIPGRARSSSRRPTRSAPAARPRGACATADRPARARRAGSARVSECSDRTLRRVESFQQPDNRQAQSTSHHSTRLVFSPAVPPIGDHGVGLSKLTAISKHSDLRWRRWAASDRTANGRLPQSHGARPGRSVNPLRH
jgi:hypothetical protein